MDGPVKEWARSTDTPYLDAIYPTLTDEQRAFVRSMQDAARGLGQPAHEFMEELRQEMLSERSAENNASHRNA